MFQKKTHHVTLGGVAGSIRGTEFVTEVNPESKSVLVVLDGEVALTDPKTNQDVAVRAGAVVFAESSGVEKPTAVDVQKLGRWWE